MKLPKREGDSDILKSNKPDDIEKRGTEPEEKSSTCHQAEWTHFDCWAGGGGEFRFLEMTTIAVVWHDRFYAHHDNYSFTIIPKSIIITIVTVKYQLTQYQDFYP